MEEASIAPTSNSSEKLSPPSNESTNEDTKSLKDPSTLSSSEPTIEDRIPSDKNDLQTEKATNELKKEETPESQSAPLKKKRKKRKKKSSAADELDIDFENFEVDADRASKIRSLVNLVKEQSLIEGLSILIKEKGVVEEQAAQEEGQFTAIKYKKGQEPRVYTPYPLHPCFGFVLRLEAKQVEIQWGEKLLLEVTLLPKEKDYIVQFVDETLWEEISGKLNLLNFEIKEARKLKSERQKEWQARFKKKG